MPSVIRPSTFTRSIRPVKLTITLIRSRIWPHAVAPDIARLRRLFSHQTGDSSIQSTRLPLILLSSTYFHVQHHFTRRYCCRAFPPQVTFLFLAFHGPFNVRGQGRKTLVKIATTLQRRRSMTATLRASHFIRIFYPLRWHTPTWPLQKHLR